MLVILALQEAEAGGGSGVQEHPWLLIEFVVSLGYMRHDDWLGSLFSLQVGQPW